MIAGAGVTLCLGALALGSRAQRDWPEVAALRSRDPETTAFIHGERERTESAEGVEWTWVGIGDISPHLVRAVLVAEDINFFSHAGFAWSAIRASVWGALRGDAELVGASTISQQLAKNLWLSPERSWLRKLKEAALTIQLERDLSKRRILELYLNVVMFGPGVFGAEAAARHFFGKSALFLTEREGAMLAASLPRPSTWNPATEDPHYWAQVERIERRMAAAEFLWRYISTW